MPPTIARFLGCSCSGSLLLRGSRIIGTTESADAAKELGVAYYRLDNNRYVWCNDRRLGKAAAEESTRQQVTAADIRARYNVLDVWRKLFPHTAPSKCGLYRSPFRDDRSPSFSVYAQGHRFSDKATGEGGSCLDFYMIATGKPLKDAIADLADGMQSRPLLSPPEHERHLVVTETQRGFAQQAADGFYDAVWSSGKDTEMYQLLQSKGISSSVAVSCYKDGSLGAIDGKPVFIYPYGIKIRHSAESSRSNRWLCGSGGEWPWRSHLIESPHLRKVVITEGETDAMRLMGYLPQGMRRLIIAAPGVSWRPSDDMLHMIGAHREVTIWFDNDKAGEDAAKELEADFAAVSHCKPRRVEFLDGDAKDICAMAESRVREIICDFC